MNFVGWIGKEKIAKIKAKLPETPDDDSKIMKLHKKVPKTSIELAILFNHSVEVLKLSKDKRVINELNKFDGIDRLNELVEEHDKGISYGKNSIQEEIKLIINKKRDDVIEVISFVFCNIMGQSSSGENPF